MVSGDPGGHGGVLEEPLRDTPSGGVFGRHRKTLTGTQRKIPSGRSEVD